MKITESSKQKPTHNEYNAFLKQIELEDIRVTNARIENLDCSYFPSSAEVKWRITARFENKGKKCNVFHTYYFTVIDKETGNKKAKIAVTFCVTYSTKTSMTDGLFEIFKTLNLPLNTWPYYREFIQTAISRMGWPPYTVPMFKL